jgi:bacillithiol synthase
LMDTFANIEEKKKEYVISQSQDLDFSDLKDIQRKLEENVLALIAKVDASLTEYGKAEMARLGKQLENLEQKLLRAEKSKHDQALKTMEQIKDRLFFGGMQERSLNFFHFCVDGQVKSHLDKLNSAIDALEKDLIVLEW